MAGRGGDGRRGARHARRRCRQHGRQRRHRAADRHLPVRHHQPRTAEVRRRRQRAGIPDRSVRAVTVAGAPARRDHDRHLVGPRRRAAGGRADQFLGRVRAVDPGPGHATGRSRHPFHVSDLSRRRGALSPRPPAGARHPGSVRADRRSAKGGGGPPPARGGALGEVVGAVLRGDLRVHRREVALGNTHGVFHVSGRVGGGRSASRDHH